jgi:glycosyltransferase involved in cell wall biosynthesis
MSNNFEEASLSVVIPVYNEEKIIKENTIFLNKALSTTILDYEIILVDDGSTDTTPDLLRELCELVPQVRVVTSRKNEGLGSALEKGFFCAGKDLVFYTDCDMPVKYSQIRGLIKAMVLHKADIVSCTKGKVFGESLLRRACSRLYNWFIGLIFDVNMKDINFSCKLFNRQVLKGLNLQSSGSFISAEIMLKASYMGLRIFQMPIGYFERLDRQSRLFRIKHIASAFHDMFKYYREVRSFRR